MPRRGGTLLLGPYLLRLRAQAGLSLRQLETRSLSYPERVNFDYLCRAEGGSVVPSPQKLIGLARIYGVPVKDILDVLEVEQFRKLQPRLKDDAECRRAGLDA